MNLGIKSDSLSYALSHTFKTNASEDELYKAIKALRQERLFDEALSLAKIIGKRFNRSQDLRFRLEFAQIIGEQGSTDDALKLFDLIKLEHPNNAHAFRLQSELLVKQEKYEQALEVLSTAPLANGVKVDTLFRAIRLAVYLSARSQSVKFTKPNQLRPCATATLLMMVRDEEDIIGENLQHHYDLGFRKFSLMLNCCRDRTEEIVNQFRDQKKDASFLIVFDQSEGYYQAAKTQSLVEFSNSYFIGIREPVDWCFIVDADEFISLDNGAGIFDLILSASNQKKPIITFHLCDSTSAECADYIPGSDIYKHFNVISPCSVPVVTKNAFMLSVGAEIEMGNHTLTYNQMGVNKHLIAAKSGARIIHLPYRSRNQLRTKIVNGGLALKATSLDENLGAHWRRSHDEFLISGEKIIETRFLSYHEGTNRRAIEGMPFIF